MEKYEFVNILEDEFQAQLLGGILEKENIPYRIRSYHDLAYDGLFQSQKGWGHIESPAEYHEEILSIFNDLNQEGEK